MAELDHLPDEILGLIVGGGPFGLTLTDELGPLRTVLTPRSA